MDKVCRLSHIGYAKCRIDQDGKSQSNRAGRKVTHVRKHDLHTCDTKKHTRENAKVISLNKVIHCVRRVERLEDTGLILSDVEDADSE